ncbi:MAG: hypothetical protein IKZ90_10965 [Clostridiales bacterium]|nr:hypothetical protein [Clostridiales bacterium]
MKEPKDNREYYEIFDFSPSKLKEGKRYEIIYAIFVLLVLALLMVLPLIGGILFRAFLISRGASDTAVKVVSALVIIALYAGVIIFIVAVADHKIPIPEKLKMPSSIYKKKYYLNVPQAYKKVHFEEVSDGDVMDRFYLDGALVSDGEIKQDRLSYIYNVLNDEYDLQGKDITIYKITAADFLAHYTFFKAPYLFRRDSIYVLPLSVLGIDREKYLKLKEESESEGHELRIAGMKTFADLLEVRSDYRRTTYLYRDAARKYFKDKM